MCVCIWLLAKKNKPQGFGAVTFHWWETKPKPPLLCAALKKKTQRSLVSLRTPPGTEEPWAGFAGGVIACILFCFTADFSLSHCRVHHSVPCWWPGVVHSTNASRDYAWAVCSLPTRLLLAPAPSHSIHSLSCCADEQSGPGRVGIKHMKVSSSFLTCLITKTKSI